MSEVVCVCGGGSQNFRQAKVLGFFLTLHLHKNMQKVYFILFVYYASNLAKGSCTKKKKRTNFGTFPGGGGVKAQSKVKGALFATDRFPLGSRSSYLTSMVVLHFSYLINSNLEPSLCDCSIIK